MLQNDKNSAIEKWLLRFIIVGCWLVVFVPLIVVSESYFPYIIQKTIIFRTLVELIFALYLVLALMNPIYRPKKTIIFWSVLAFFAVMLITTFTSQSFHRSWWGNWERMFGTFNYLHYLLYFVILSGVLHRIKDWSRILNLTLLVSLIISLYSISQRIGLGFTFQSGLERVNGTIGNSSYLASYMLFHIFIALLFLIEKKKWFKIYYLAVFLFDFFVLFLTGTRGAQLALFMCLPITLIFAVILKIWSGKSAKIVLGMIAFLIIIFGGLFAFKSSPFVQNNYWLRRMTDYSLTGNTVLTRMHTWSYGLKSFKDNLLLGLGPENYNLAFNSYFTGDFYDYTGNEIWFDRAHNTLIDMASMMGIFGFLAYLGLFATAGYSLTKLYQSQKISKPLYLTAVLLFFAYFFQNIFVFDALSNLIPFYLFLAYCSFLQDKFLTNAQVEKKSWSVPLYITVPFAGAGFLFLLFCVNIPEIKANQYVYQAYIGSQYNNYGKALDNYKKAREFAINKIDLPILLASAFSELLNNPAKENIEQQIKDVKMGIQWLDEAIALDQKNMFLYYLQSKNYITLASLTRDGNDLDKAVVLANQSADLSKENIRPVWLLAQIYSYGGQPQTALAYLDEAEKINSNLPETYIYRLEIYKNLGEKEKMYQQYDATIEHHFAFRSMDIINEFLSYYEPKNDYQKIIYLYKQMAALDYTKLYAWNKLIDLSYITKNETEALNYIADAKNYIPDFKYVPQAK